MIITDFLKFKIERENRKIDSNVYAESIFKLL